MKTTLSTILLTLFIFTTITLQLLSADATVIYDSFGNTLLRGIPYYILPLLRGSGGGLTVSQTTKNACPLNVTQEPFEANHGVPFTFTPIVLDKDIIHGSYPISIKAFVVNRCSGSNIWKVVDVAQAKDNDDEVLTRKKDHDKKKKDDDDEDGGGGNVKIVTTNGEFNKPESCFQIVEDNIMPGMQSYQIQNCPFKCGSSSSGFTCYNVGVVIDGDGNRYLGRTDVVFPVVFTSSYGTFSQSAAKTSMFRELPTKLNTV